MEGTIQVVLNRFAWLGGAGEGRPIRGSPGLRIGIQGDCEALSQG